MSEHKSVLTEAEGLVHGDRNEDYGHPLDDFHRTSLMWQAILGAHVTPEQVGLCMIAVKLSRECHKHKRDNLVGIAEYAETVAWAKDELADRLTNTETFGPIDAEKDQPHIRFNATRNMSAIEAKEYLRNYDKHQEALKEAAASVNRHQVATDVSVADS